MSTPERLCQLCENMAMEDIWRSETGYEHLSDIWTLETAAKSCAVCNLMFLKLLDSAFQLTDENEEIEDLERALEILKPGIGDNGYILTRPCQMIVQAYPSGSLGYRNLHIGARFEKSSGFNWGREKTLFPVGVSLGTLVLHPVGSKNHAKPLTPRVNDAEILDFLARRLPSQSFPQARTPLPTRVLDLGDYQDSTLTSPQPDIRLLETKGAPGLYVTLSYCWGSYRDCRTLTSNLESRKKRIIFDELPKVFQQAVIFTRALGVRYLWIDALCIIQDNTEDWEREAAKMGDVYSRGYCRLAATASKRPTEPFWPPRPIVPSVRVPSLLEPDIDGKVQEHYLTFPKYYSYDVETALLNQRGWVLQERLLAPRTIHFTKDHIYYEDEDGIIGEDGIARWASWLSCINKSSQYSRMNLFPEFRNSRSHNYEVLESGTDSWLKIAEVFSHCKLSYPTDRLFALAALVEAKQGSIGDRGTAQNELGNQRARRGQYTGSPYFVGLWEKTLHVDLIWTANPNTNLEYLDSLRLPSWSWLAYDGSIAFLKDQRSLREQETVKCAPLSEIQLVDSHVIEFRQNLPAKELSFLILKIILRSSIRVSDTFVEVPSRYETRDELVARSPFCHDPYTKTVPIQLASLTRCGEIYDDSVTGTDGKPRHIGFISFDDDSRLLESDELILGHVSTLLDEVDIFGQLGDAGLAPTAFYNPAHRVIEDGQLPPGGDPGPIKPILAYCLVLRKMGETAEGFRRVGVAEVSYDWMKAGSEETIKLF